VGHLSLGTARFELLVHGLPIKDRQHVIGTLTIDRAWMNWGTMHIDDDLRFLKMVANLIGQTVRLHRMVMRDRTRLLEEQGRLSKQHSGARAMGRLRSAKAALRWPTAGRCSWTRSAKSHPRSRLSCCGCCRKASSSALAATAR
jgi:hypothetical protein